MKSVLFLMVICSVSLAVEREFTTQPQALFTAEHENTHDMNSVFRNAESSIFPINAVYAYPKTVFIVREPNFRLSDVANKIPGSMRGISYNTYLLSQQTWWQNEPLNVLDEWYAYTNGTIYYKETNQMNSAGFSLSHAMEMTNYSIVLLAMAKEDVKYDCTTLTKCIQFNSRRLANLYVRARRDGWVRMESHNALRSIQTEDDTVWVRRFCIRHFGKRWSKDDLGIEQVDRKILRR
jgi:hypothetical protein